MNLRSVSDIIHRGGTILYTAHSPEFNTPVGVRRKRRELPQAGNRRCGCGLAETDPSAARGLTGAGIPCIRGTRHH